MDQRIPESLLLQVPPTTGCVCLLAAVSVRVLELLSGGWCLLHVLRRVCAAHLPAKPLPPSSPCVPCGWSRAWPGLAASPPPFSLALPFTKHTACPSHVPVGPPGSWGWGFDTDSRDPKLCLVPVRYPGTPDMSSFLWPVGGDWPGVYASPPAHCMEGFGHPRRWRVAFFLACANPS